MRATYLVLCLLPFTGCATIMEGSGQSVTIATDPAGALCNVDRAGTHLGTVANTPGSLRIDKSKNDLAVSCTKDGYQTASVNQSPKFVGTTFGNVLIGGLVGVVVDAATGSNFEYPTEVRLNLAPVAGTPPPAATGPNTPTTHASPEIAPVSQEMTIESKDGYYTGLASATDNKSGRCPASMRFTVRVADGRASARYNATTPLTGTIQPDGTLPMTGNGTTFAGKVSGNQLTGQSDNERCSYRFALTRIT